jgi:hypothetical protein
MTENGTRPKTSSGTSHRLYAVVAAAVVFLVTWAAVAARPWASATPDPRLAALAQREQRLRAEARLVQRIVDERQAAYRIALKARQAQIAAVRARSQQATRAAARPAVRVVELPPLTITRTS